MPGAEDNAEILSRPGEEHLGKGLAWLCAGDWEGAEGGTHVHVAARSGGVMVAVAHCV